MYPHDHYTNIETYQIVTHFFVCHVLPINLGFAAEVLDREVGGVSPLCKCETLRKFRHSEVTRDMLDTLAGVK